MEGRIATLAAAERHVDETIFMAGGGDLLDVDNAVVQPAAAAAILNRTVDYVPAPADVTAAEGGSASPLDVQALSGNDALGTQLAGIGYTAVNPEAN